MTVSVFPSLPGITYPVVRTTVWDTVKKDALSGKRVRLQNRAYPTYVWEVPFNGFLRSAAAFLEWQALQDFLNNMYGGFGFFLYSDPNDGVATLQNIGTGDGATSTFQLVRSLPGGTFLEPVFFPNVVAQVTVGGVAVSPANYAVNPFGSITFASIPNGGAAIAWTGTFRWGCQIDGDETPFENIMLNLWQLKSIKFSSSLFSLSVIPIPQPTPQPTIFTLGSSTLGGPDVLG